jgi:hypothetical protein
MPERRYSRYKQEDVWAQLYQLQHQLGVTVQDGTVYGHSVWLTWKNQQVKAVILARSSDWYAYSLNCTERFRHELHVVVCGTHDSCLDRPVLALDSMRWYAPLEMRIQSLEPLPQRESNNTGPLDAFDRRRKSHYGHNMLIGALMCGRPDALKRLKNLSPSTRLRIEAEVRALHMRRRGRPLKV